MYGRTLAEIVNIKGVNINRKMVENGMAIYYPFQSGCKDFQALETSPRKAKTGVWSDPKFEAPWEYRKRNGIGKIGVTKSPNVTKN
jgi:endonuclease YncB( thermonuclease family)